ncbi:sensor histidine kinase [Miniphocaeibacter massiliensis]|uniref:sensor histidine kinase n=1 Tax=Miniphocaeibacter massiliensis TaxID=2041841 RepID=UPI000C079C8F|nr:HAMP domain-containing sensor histidine kinase [Miniphocaeibacter massiliensis]
MNNFKNSKKIYYKLFLIVLLFIVLLIDSLIIFSEVKNYNDKLRIVLVSLSEEDNTKILSDILKKNEDINVERGEKTLEEYGFSKTNNQLYSKLKTKIILIVIISIVFYLLIAYIILLTYKLEKNMLKEDINKLSELISNYRDNKFHTKNIKLENESLVFLKENLIALGSYLSLLTAKINEEKEETKVLVTDISHQLKTPVAALKNSLEILENVKLTKEEAKEFYSRAMAQVNGIDNLLKALLNISRMEKGLIDIKKEKSFILDTIVDAINIVYTKAESKNIAIEVNSENDVDKLEINHDKKWMRETFVNILDNAIKYSKENTIIEIKIIKMASFLRIEFIDEGVGIKKTEYNNIFKRFYRGENEVVKNNSGSGVGLYLCREIVSKHHGTISVKKNKLKDGSTFIVQIPYN